METITSRHNPLVKHLRRLASSGSYRRERGEFLRDSPKLLRNEALLHGAELLTVAATRGMTLPDGIHAGVRLVEVPEDVMQLISLAKTPQGVVLPAACRGRSARRRSRGRAISRSTACRTRQRRNDPAHARRVRGGRAGAPAGVRGSVFAEDGALVDGCGVPPPVWTCTVETFAQVLRGAGLRLLGAALRMTRSTRAVDYTRAVLAIGSEGRGLSDEVLALCDETVRIPMSPRCESLNAAVAASVLILWEAYR